MALERVRVRRERPTALAWAVALAVTALAVYLITLPRAEEESLFVSAPVTRRLSFAPIEAWCVTLADCDTPEAARVTAATYAGRGAAGCAVEREGTWRVLGACYPARREAERMAGRLRAEEGLAAGVERLAAEGVSLRCTAPAEALDALAAGDRMLREQGERLGELAQQLDRGEAEPGAVRALCAVAAGEAEAAGRALARCGEEGAAAGLAGLLAQRAALLSAAARGDRLPPATLSGLVRCAQIEGLLGQVAWQAGLGGG